MRDVVGLYLDPPRARRSCSASMRRARSRPSIARAPILPLRPGLPEKATHDYVRHGTTTLFAALEVATGRVTDACYERHRHEEFLAFLKQVARAYPRRAAARGGRQLRHPQAPRRRGLAGQHPRITLHFTPTVGLVAEPGRGLLQHHHPPGHPPRHLHQRQGAGGRHPPVHRRLERPLPSRSPGPRPPTRSSATRDRVRGLQTQNTRGINHFVWRITNSPGILRSAVIRSKDLVASIRICIEHPRPFLWHKGADKSFY